MKLFKKKKKKERKEEIRKLLENVGYSKKGVRKISRKLLK